MQLQVERMSVQKTAYVGSFQMAIIAIMSFPRALNAGGKIDLSARVGWNSSPPERGTMDILWTCSLALSICLYTLLHLNVPAPSDGLWTLFLRKLKWFLCGYVVPIIPMLFVFAQWSAAKRSVEDMHHLVRGGNEWTLVHGYFADSGGFVLCSSDV